MSVFVVKNGFPKLAAELGVVAKAAELSAAQHVAQKARAAAPRATGNLRASIRPRPTKEGAEVVSGVIYGRFQEYGTEKMDANPFFFQAVDGEEHTLMRPLLSILRRRG